jgi:hypothetical protein
MLTWLGYIDGIHATIYIPYMDPMGDDQKTLMILDLGWFGVNYMFNVRIRLNF